MKARGYYFQFFFSVISIIVVLGSLLASPAPVSAEMYPTVIGSFSFSGGLVQGLAWGNGSLWVATETQIRRVSATGAVLETYAAPVSSITDLAWYENSLWVFGWNKTAGTGVHKLNASMGITETLNVDEWMDEGFEWVDGSLYITNYNNGNLGHYNRDGVRLGSISLGSGYFHPVGMASDGTNLWIGDSSVGPIYRYTTSGELIDVADFSDIDTTCGYSSPINLAWDGQYLWYACNTKIYHIDILGPFVDAEVGLAGVELGETAWGDYDSDEDLDIALIGLAGTSPITRIYRNDGNNVYVNSGASLVGVYNGSVDWGDYDRDGDLDLLITGCAASSCTSRTFRIYRNTNGAFANVIGTGLPGVAGSDARWGDYDSDGDLDILMLGHNGSGGMNRIYRNNGTGAFTEIQLLDHAYGPVSFQLYNGAVSWADYDNDGDLDALLTGCYTATCYQTSVDVYRNEGQDIFTLAFNGRGARYSSVDWGDYDNDGDLDILLAGSAGWAAYEECVTEIYQNEDSGASFTNIEAILTGACSGSAVWGDYDNDGDLDIGLTGESTPNGYQAAFSMVYRNEGGGDFTNINASMLEPLDGSLAWGDSEKDGDLDLLLTGSGYAGIYINGTATPNTLPTAPDSLGVDFSLPGYVQLNWNEGEDLQTPVYGLSYNARLGTTPSSADIISPMSIRNNGTRMVPQLGGAGSSGTFKVSGLQGGRTYYWSVQSVDSAFAGSPFASEQSFFLPPVGSFTQSVYPVAESAGSLDLTVTLDAAPTNTVTIQYAASDSTAAAGSDYTATSGTLTFESGQTSATVTIPILDDPLDEYDETLKVTLSTPAEAVLGFQYTTLVSITDNDEPAVRFSASTYSVNEDAGTATITVSLSTPARAPEVIQVNHSTSDGSAVAGSDYSGTSTIVTFNTGETSKTLTIPITDDTAQEGSETINLTLSSPSYGVLGTPSTAVLTIVDNDIPTVSFDSATYSVNEGSGTAAVTVILSRSSTQSITVQYATSNGSAVAGSDYTATSGSLTFNPGVTTRTFTVPIIEDTLQEGDETVILTLSNPTNAMLGEPNPATLTILANDNSAWNFKVYLSHLTR